MYRFTPHRHIALHSLFITFSFATIASAASFDCKLARTPRERAICASPDLSAKDSALAAAYTRQRSRLSPAASAVVQADQRAWLIFLDRACVSNGKGSSADLTECLANEYSSRLSDFKPKPPLTAGSALFTHRSSILAPGKLDADNPRNPGFGTGGFAMPQIDNPNPQQQAFNAAVTSAVIHQSSNDPRKPASTFLEATDDESTTEVTYALGGQNARLLAVNFELFEMGYGAAHPSTRDFTFNWWLDTGRELQATDVFRPDSSWQTALTAAAATKLRTDHDMLTYLWKGAELSRGIREGLDNPRQWTVSRTGLTVSFGQYQVAAYVAGMPAVRFSWKELQPYMNASMHPETLPAVAPPAN